jgi:hypothetical protein
MNRNLLAGTIGTLMTVLGVFLPVVRNGLTGDITLLTFARPYAIALLVSAAMSFVFSLTAKYKAIWAPAILNAVLIAMSYAQFYSLKSEAEAVLNNPTGGREDAFANLIAGAAQSAEIVSLGWIVLCAGLISFVAAAHLSAPKDVA